MRTVALDVHTRFAEVAVHEDGVVRRFGRVETRGLQAFAESLGSDDHVVLESTSFTWAIAELLGRYPGKVTVSNPMQTKAIASAKMKTDKVDARVLAQLAAADFLPSVWAPDPATRASAAAGRAPSKPRAAAHPSAQPGARGACPELGRGAGQRPVRAGRPPLARCYRAARARAGAGR